MANVSMLYPQKTQRLVRKELGIKNKLEEQIFDNIEAVTGGVLKNVGKFTGKHLCQTLAQVFSRECSEIFKNTFLTEQLRVTSSELLR